VTQKYDVWYGPEGPSLELHFCRDIDCFGTNEDHGFTFDEACEDIASYYENQSKLWRTKEHPNCKLYIEMMEFDGVDL
tara:strand:- start:6922 stop:7155 length:234 start_codon:yes stop_codon:yes gene_type:complete